MQSGLSILCKHARSRWPGVDLPEEQFAERLRMGRGSDEPLPKPSARTSDLYLAGACLAGNRAALAHLNQLCHKVCSRLISRPSFGAASAEELAADLAAHVIVGTENAPPRLAAYRGDATLARWLTIAAVRLVQIAVRSRRPESCLPRDSLHELVGAPHPELVLLKQQYGAAVRTALTNALARLSPRQRNVLRHHAIDRLSIDQIASAYRVHRATAARWLVSIREQILTDTKQELCHALALDAGEVERVVRLVLSQIEVSLSRLLQAEDSSQHEASQGVIDSRRI